MTIRTASLCDFDKLYSLDKHISENELLNLLRQGRVLITEENGEFVGWLRYGLFWDNTPFMNMLYILSGSRGKGCGRKLVEHWESQMKADGYKTVMTSTQSDEYGQHFYAKLGYRAVGGFIPLHGAFEVIFEKEL